MKALRLVTIMLTALSMAAAMGHLLEMPVKLTFDGALWLHLLQNLYVYFGWLGGVGEIGAVVCTIVLAILLRKRGQAFRWTLAAAVCMAVAHAIFWTLVHPVNVALLPLTADSLPSDWPRLRDQWENSHAARAILQVFALGSLVMSLLAEIPRHTTPKHEPPHAS